jgi:serine-type D-Ala-D-Ala carboxypeptidase
MGQDIAGIVEEGVEDGTFPGAVVLVEKDRHTVLAVVRGERQVHPAREPMTADTLFDLASLTKPLATAPLVLAVCGREGIDLSSRLERFLPELPLDTGEITILQALLHTGGLPPVPDLYTQFPESDRVDPAAAERLLLSRRPQTKAGAEVIYSCTGYQLLGLFLKRVTGLRVGELFRTLIAEPCGITDLLFRPGAEDRRRAAATEWCAWRKRWIRGEVHDENSWCLGGDAGNAGLFGTGSAVLRWISVFCTGGVLDCVRVLSESAVRLMRTCLTEGMNRRRAVGFMMHDAEAPVGPLYGADSFGHTGFTGTSVWIEPSLDLRVVTLTNRVHLGREGTAPKIVDFRLRLHEAVYREFQ